MPRKKEITAARSFGAVSKAKVFEELIWIVCGKRVKLKPAERRIYGQENGQASGQNKQDQGGAHRTPG
jgi:hypothetical protein